MAVAISAVHFLHNFSTFSGHVSNKVARELARDASAKLSVRLFTGKLNNEVEQQIFQNFSYSSVTGHTYYCGEYREYSSHIQNFNTGWPTQLVQVIPFF